MRNASNTHLVNIGFKNTVSAGRIIAVLSPESAPIKRLIATAKDNDRLIDATYGRKTRAVIMCDNQIVILSCVHPDTITGRVMDRAANAQEEYEREE